MTCEEVLGGWLRRMNEKLDHFALAGAPGELRADAARESLCAGER